MNGWFNKRKWVDDHYFNEKNCLVVYFKEFFQIISDLILGQSSVG